MLSNWSIIILAAGRGTRLGSNIVKPLVEVHGTPLIAPILRNALELPFAERFVVISTYTQEVTTRFSDPRLTYITSEPNGTGGCTLAALAQVRTPYVMVAQADDSFLYEADMLREMMISHEAQHPLATIGVVTVTEALPYAYLEHDGPKLLAIHKDLADLDAPPPKDVGCGLYAFSTKWLQSILPGIPANHKGEVSLPKVFDAPTPIDQLRVFEVPTEQWQGVNTPEELALIHTRSPKPSQ